MSERIKIDKGLGKWGKKRNERKGEDEPVIKKDGRSKENTTSVSNRNLAHWQSRHPPLTTHTVSW